MTAKATYTWDFDLAATPPVVAAAASIGDLGDAALVDDAANPPIPPQMPYSAQLNQWATQLGGMNRVIVAADIQIHFVAGAPTLYNVAAMSSLINTAWAVAQANMTVTHVGAGVVTVSWPQGSIPPPRAVPRAWALSGPNAQPVAVATTVAGNPGVQVSTWNLSGTPTDMDFVVSVY